MRKNLLFCASMLACIGVAVVGCQKDINNPNKPNTDIKAVSFEQAYDASVLSGIGLLNSGVSSSGLMSYNVSLMADTEVENTSKPQDKKENGLDKLTDGLKKEILDNLAIANSTINGDSTKSEVKKSDRAEWEEMYTITQKDISGNDVVYTFYYTEALGDLEEENKKEKTLLALAEEENENDNNPKDEVEDEEIEKHIKGVVVALDKEYDVSGDREIEGTEESVSYKIMLDSDNYVVIENEVEGTENEYEYSKYENGKRVFKSEVEYEINENGEVEIEFETKTKEDGKVKFSYEFVSKDNESLINVEIKKAKDNVKAKAVIKVLANENEEISYEFIEYSEKK